MLTSTLSGIMQSVYIPGSAVSLTLLVSSLDIYNYYSNYFYCYSHKNELLFVARSQLRYSDITTANWEDLRFKCLILYISKQAKKKVFLSLVENLRCKPNFKIISQ